MNIRTALSAIRNNLKGWKTSRKIVVFESDDWGSIRMPSKEVYDKLLNQGIRVDKCPFSKFDNLENALDFEALFSVLYELEKKIGSPPIITTNFIMGNPDFKRIKEDNFKKYHVKPLKDYLDESNKLKIYQDYIDQGILNNYIRPQLHGREHVNISLWLKYLNIERTTKTAFELGVYGISTNIVEEKRPSFLASFDYESRTDLSENILPSIKQGALWFKDFFGYKSKSFIAPNYCWDDLIEEHLMQQGIDIIQSSKMQIVSRFSRERLGTSIERVTGQKNNFGQVYITRNAIFEPATQTRANKKQHLEECFNRIKIAFLLGKPAIISTHRLNFMGGLSEDNRNENLKLFEQLVLRIFSNWPEVEFMSSDQVGRLIHQNS